MEIYTYNRATGRHTLQNRIDNRTLKQAKESRILMVRRAAAHKFTDGAGISVPDNAPDEVKQKVAQYNTLFGKSRPVSDIDRLNPNRSVALQNFIDAMVARQESTEAEINAATTLQEVDAVRVDFSDINYR